MDLGEQSEINLDYYDGFLFFLDPDEYTKFYEILNNVNFGTALSGVLINTVHLSVLLQKELRGIPVFTLMIGVAICETLMVTAFSIDFLLDHDYLYQKKDCGDNTYLHVLINLINEFVETTTRRCSSILALLMALIRTLSVTFPLSQRVSKFSDINNVIAMLFLSVIICVVFDGWMYSKYEIEQLIE